MMKQQCQYESNFPIITFNHRPLPKDCRPLVEVSGQAVVGRGWRFSPADVQQLPAELETGTLWPLVCAAARRGPGGVPQGKAGDGDGWDALAALDWFQRVKELDLRPFLVVYNQSQRGLAVVERLKMANLGPESIVLDGLSLPGICSPHATPKLPLSTQNTQIQKYTPPERPAHVRRCAHFSITPRLDRHGGRLLTRRQPLRGHSTLALAS
jgi:hypothetical protein